MIDNQIVQVYAQFMIPGAVALNHRIAVTCGQLNAAHGQLVTLVAEAITAEAWAGFRSVEHWLTIQAGISTSTAARIVSIARRVGELPVTIEGLVRGELTVDQAAVVARFVPAHNDTEVLQFAAAATVSQLRSTLRRYPFDHPAGERVETADGESGSQGPVGEPGDTGPVVVDGMSGPVDIGDRYRCSWMFDDDGNFRLHLTADAVDGKLIETAINTAYARLIADGGDVTNLMAFVDMADVSLNNLPGPGPVDRTRVHIHLDTAGAFVHQGPRIPSSLRDRILCDAVLRPVWETDGHPVNVGRDQRVVPERTRRVIEQRDRCCRFPGCTSTRHLDVHHIIHWIHDGVTDTWNLVLLCPHHHRAHHRGDFALVGNAEIQDHHDHPDGLIFTRPDGTRIRACQRPVTPAGPIPTPVSRFVHPTGERFDASLLAFRQSDGTFHVPGVSRSALSVSARRSEHATTPATTVIDRPVIRDHQRTRQPDNGDGEGDGDGSDDADDSGHTQIDGHTYLDLTDQPMF
jgi:hypothetical protein